MKFNISYKDLKAAERSVYSQGGQDGVLEAIFNQIGIAHDKAMEFGARDGFDLSNTANLNFSKRLLIDAEPKSQIVEKGFITKENINNYARQFDFDYISIDMDGNDYWVWEAMENKPRVLTIEYNSKFNNNESVVIEYNPDHIWEGDDYYSASLFALKKLGERKGYTLVYVVDRFDAVFIRNDLISEDYVIPTLDELLPLPIIAHETISNKKWVIV